MKPRSEYLLIIDGSSLLATSYYSSLPKAIRAEKDDEKKKELYPKLLKKDRQGRYCNALESFFHTIFTIMTFQRPTHLAVCWDVSRHTFRKTLWPSYKSNRSQTPEPLSQQYETAYEICMKLRIPQFRDQAYEADDFAGSLAVQLEGQLPVRILTRDKDYFQLISPRTRIWYGMSDLGKVRSWRTKYEMPHGLPSRVVEMSTPVLEAEFGYSPDCVCMMKALLGDRSDNIPGVRGMGETRSIALARHYSTPDELYGAIHKARATRQKNVLIRTWRSWGIHSSPYNCLTRKAEGDRLSAMEMANICYTLGKMKTDIDLGAFCTTGGPGFCKKHLRFSPSQKLIVSVLAEYDIVLRIGSKRPFGKQPSAAKQASCVRSEEREPAKSSSKGSRSSAAQKNARRYGKPESSSQNRRSGSRNGSSCAARTAAAASDTKSGEKDAKYSGSFQKSSASTNRRKPGAAGRNVSKSVQKPTPAPGEKAAASSDQKTTLKASESARTRPGSDRCSQRRKPENGRMKKTSTKTETAAAKAGVPAGKQNPSALAGSGNLASEKKHSKRLDSRAKHSEKAAAAGTREAGRQKAGSKSRMKQKRSGPVHSTSRPARTPAGSSGQSLTPDQKGQYSDGLSKTAKSGPTVSMQKPAPDKEKAEYKKRRRPRTHQNSHPPGGQAGAPAAGQSA